MFADGRTSAFDARGFPALMFANSSTATLDALASFAFVLADCRTSTFDASGFQSFMLADGRTAALDASAFHLAVFALVCRSVSSRLGATRLTRFISLVFLHGEIGDVGSRLTGSAFEPLVCHCNHL